MSGGCLSDCPCPQKGSWPSLASSYGGEDIQVGDAEVDDALIIRGGTPDQVAAWLRQPGPRSAALRLARIGGDSSVQEGAVQLVRRGFLAGNAVKGLLDEACEISREFGAGTDVGPTGVAMSMSIDPRLQELSAGGLGIERRKALAAELAGEDLMFDALVARVRPTTDPAIPPALAGGRTALASCGDVHLILRYGPGWNEDLDAVKPGVPVAVLGRVSGWDVGEQRIVFDIS